MAKEPLLSDREAGELSETPGPIGDPHLPEGSTNDTAENITVVPKSDVPIADYWDDPKLMPTGSITPDGNGSWNWKRKKK